MRRGGWAVAAAVVLATAACLPGGGLGGPDPREYFSADDDVELARAVARGDADEIAALVAAGADPDAVGDEGRVTMLHWAVLAESPDGLQALLDADADPDATGANGPSVLHTAADGDDVTYLQLLLDEGADPDVQNARTGTVALTVACVGAWRESLTVLLAAGADPDVLDPNGGVPLHACGRTNQGWMVLELLEAGADPLAESSTGSDVQDYYFQIDVALLTEDSLAARNAVADWLEDHGIPLVPGARG